MTRVLLSLLVVTCETNQVKVISMMIKTVEITITVQIQATIIVIITTILARMTNNIDIVILKVVKKIAVTQEDTTKRVDT